MDNFFEELKNIYKDKYKNKNIYCISEEIDRLEIQDYMNTDDQYIKVIQKEDHNKVSVYITIYDPIGGEDCYREDEDNYHNEDDFEERIKDKVDELENVTGVKPEIIESEFCGRVNIGYFNIGYNYFESNNLFNI